jgi:hypothetical protein
MILSYISNLPIITAILLLLVMHFLCWLFFPKVTYSLKSGVVIMAWAMYFWVCLPVYGVSNPAMILPALIIMVVWCYVLFMYINATLINDKPKHSKFNLFDMGYWVSGTTLMVVLLDEAERSLHGFIIFFGLVSIAIYLYYLLSFLKWLHIAHHKRFHIYTNDILFLLSISTLSILLLFQEVTDSKLSPWINHTLITFSALAYLGAFKLVMDHRLNSHYRHFILSWTNASVLDYGALALMGVCLIKAYLYPFWLITSLWWIAIVILMATELILLWHTIVLLRHKGLHHLWFVQNNNTTWLRIFSLSIFYKFTLEYYHLNQDTNWIAMMVVDYGQYLITLLLLIQLIRILPSMLRGRINE